MYHVAESVKEKDKDRSESSSEVQANGTPTTANNMHLHNEATSSNALPGGDEDMYKPAEPPEPQQHVRSVKVTNLDSPSLQHRHHSDNTRHHSDGPRVPSYHGGGGECAYPCFILIFTHNTYMVGL